MRKKLWQIIKDSSYNLDRTIASLLGAPPQATISSQLGNNRNKWWGRVGCKCLDKIVKNHCDHAVKKVKDLADDAEGN